MLEAVGKNLFDFLIDTDELDGLLWELFLYLFGVDEEILQEGPGSLDLTNDNNDFTDGGKGFLPEVDLFLKSGEISGREHRCNSDLVFFKHIKVLLRESDHLNSGIFMWLELENDILPCILELLKSLLHLCLLSSLIGDFLNIFLVFTKIEIVDIRQ
jgi:hypothetical protein